MKDFLLLLSGLVLKKDFSALSLNYYSPLKDLHITAADKITGSILVSICFPCEVRVELINLSAGFGQHAERMG